MSRILFVEDETAFAVGMIDRLESEGYEVEWAPTGPAGYQAALARPFDLIVSISCCPAGTASTSAATCAARAWKVPLEMLVIDHVEKEPTGN